MIPIYFYRWSQFKAERPEDFPFQQPRHIEIDIPGAGTTTVRDVLSPPPPSMRSPLDRPPPSAYPPPPMQALTPEIEEAEIPKPLLLEQAPDILAEAQEQLNTGKMTHQQHQEILKQLHELYRLQQLKHQLRERDSSGGLTSPPFDMRPQVSRRASYDGPPRGILNRPSPPMADEPGNRDRLPPLNAPDSDSRNRLTPPKLEPPPMPPFERRDSRPSMDPRNGPVDESSRSPVYRDDHSRSSSCSKDDSRYRDMNDKYDRKDEPRRHEISDRDDRRERRDDHRDDRHHHRDDRKRPDPRGAKRGDKRSSKSPTPPPEKRQYILPYDTIKYYVPSHDSRWFAPVREHSTFPSETIHEIQIDGVYYAVGLNEEPKKLKIDHNYSLTCNVDHETKEVFINNSCYYRIGEPRRNIVIAGRQHRIMYHGPMRRIWIDEVMFDIWSDAPPTKIKLDGEECSCYIDALTGELEINEEKVCKIGFEPVTCEIFGVERTITTTQSSKKILLDGILSEMDFRGRYPCVKMKNQEKGIRFDGPPREIIINDRKWTVNMNKGRRVKLGGNTHVIAYGGPGHEVIIDGKWYQCKFNNEEKEIRLGMETHKIRLEPPGPEVKILGNFIDHAVMIKKLVGKVVVDPELNLDDRVGYVPKGLRPRPRTPPPMKTEDEVRRNDRDERRMPPGGPSSQGPPREGPHRDGPPRFNGPPGHRPRFDGPPDHRQRFDGPPEHRPRFDGPADQRPRFDGPPDQRPRFDGPPDQRPRFDGPPDQRPRFDGPPDQRPRFDGPPDQRPRFDGPPDQRPRFDGPPDQRPRFDGPPDQMQRFDGPPRFDGPGPRGPPRFDGPPGQGPRFDGPPGQRPQFDGPPQGQPRFDGPPGPGPRGPRPRGPVPSLLGKYLHIFSYLFLH